MPLRATSPIYLHVLQNLSLIGISVLFSPVCSLLVIWSRINWREKELGKQRGSLSRSLRPRIVLVTGVGMNKGLSIARAFYREGHTVIGADFEPYRIPVCGRFSKALIAFYRLSAPVPSSNEGMTYADELIEIIKRERVELWVSCSGVATAIEDAAAAEKVERHTSCKAIQFGAQVTSTLHEKHSFITQAGNFHLNVPETHLVISSEDAMKLLHPENPNPQTKEYIMKSIGLDDSIRADMTRLPRPSQNETQAYLSRLRPSETRPFVLQQYIHGREYCTHSLVVRGRVALFTACSSAELLMHYQAIPPDSALSKAMQDYTQTYAEKLGDVTGHFSIDFILDEDDTLSNLDCRLYPIECNPRAHTAVVLFEDESRGMTDAYLSVLNDAEQFQSKNPPTCFAWSSVGYYWIGHDIVALLAVPLLSALTLRLDFPSLLERWREFAVHAMTWRDAMFQSQDPWPFWELYCIYWPATFLMALLRRDWWSRCNVSTTKMFRC